MPQGDLTRPERRRRDDDLDRIEDRLRDAPEGLHDFGDARDEAEVVAAGLALPHALLWARWDGIAIGHATTELDPVDQHAQQTREAIDAGIIVEGDRLIGRVGRDLLVIPRDPWEDGADVLLVGEDGQRGPYASCVERLVLAAMAESSVIYDDDGEHRDGIFDEETDEFLPATRRRLLRRRLDLDEDAPLPRFELGQDLLAQGSYAGAIQELRRVVELAPNFNWAHHELGRALFLTSAAAPRAGKEAPAFRALREAAELTSEPGLRAYFLAWACRACTEPGSREQTAAKVLELQPQFAAQQERAARELLDEGDLERASLHLALGLAVAPRHLGLLSVPPIPISV